jgi:hypothetical protein
MEGVCSHTPYAHCFYAMRSWRVCRRALLLVWAKAEGTRVRGPLGCREGSVAKFDFWAKSKIMVSGIQ